MIHLPAYPNSVMFKTSELVALTLPRQNPFRFLATPSSHDRFASDENTSLQENALKWKEAYVNIQSKSKEVALYLDAKSRLIEQILEVKNDSK